MENNFTHESKNAFTPIPTEVRDEYKKEAHNTLETLLAAYRSMSPESQFEALKTNYKALYETKEVLHYILRKKHKAELAEKDKQIEALKRQIRK